MVAVRRSAPASSPPEGRARGVCAVAGGETVGFIGAGLPSRVPQVGQKEKCGGQSAPQPGHGLCCLAPQFGQNANPPWISQPHSWQFIDDEPSNEPGWHGECGASRDMMASKEWTRVTGFASNSNNLDGRPRMRPPPGPPDGFPIEQSGNGSSAMSASSAVRSGHGAASVDGKTYRDRWLHLPARGTPPPDADRWPRRRSGSPPSRW